MDQNVLIAVAYAHIINDVAREREQLFYQVEAPRGAIVKSKRGVICILMSLYYAKLKLSCAHLDDDKNHNKGEN